MLYHGTILPYQKMEIMLRNIIQYSNEIETYSTKVVTTQILNKKFNSKAFHDIFSFQNLAYPPFIILGIRFVSN